MSQKELEVLQFITDYKASHNGNSPSYDDIAEACGVSSRSTIKYYLNRLEEDGHLTRDGVKAISIPGWVYRKLKE